MSDGDIAIRARRYAEEAAIPKTRSGYPKHKYDSCDTCLDVAAFRMVAYIQGWKDAKEDSKSEGHLTLTLREVVDVVEAASADHYRSRERQTHRNRLWKNYKAAYRDWTGRGTYQPARDSNFNKAERMIEAVVNTLDGQIGVEIWQQLEVADDQLAELVKTQPERTDKISKQ